MALSIDPHPAGFSQLPTFFCCKFRLRNSQGYLPRVNNVPELSGAWVWRDFPSKVSESPAQGDGPELGHTPPRIPGYSLSGQHDLMRKELSVARYVGQHGTQGALRLL